jgi:hypothetical protein
VVERKIHKYRRLVCHFTSFPFKFHVSHQGILQYRFAQFRISGRAFEIPEYNFYRRIVYLNFKYNYNWNSCSKRGNYVELIWEEGIDAGTFDIC